MEHTARGAHKVLDECTLPKTGERIVDMLITGWTLHYHRLEKAVFVKQDGELVLTEVAKESSLEELRSLTGYNFKTANALGVF
jgi:3-oxoacid CoA-transferase